MDQHEANLSDLKQTVDVLSGRVADVEADVDGLADDVNTLVDSVWELGLGVDELSTDADSLKGTVSDLDVALAAALVDISALESTAPSPTEASLLTSLRETVTVSSNRHGGSDLVFDGSWWAPTTTGPRVAG